MSTRALVYTDSCEWQIYVLGAFAVCGSGPVSLNNDNLPTSFNNTHDVGSDPRTRIRRERLVTHRAPYRP